MTVSSQPSQELRLASFASLCSFAMLVSLLTSCYYDPYAFQAGGSGYNTYGRQLPATAYQTPQAPIGGQRQVAYPTQPSVYAAPSRQPSYANVQPYVYPQPAANPYPYAAAPYPSDSRWNTGNDWITRQQGAKVNTRGSGRAWRNRALGQRRSPSPEPASNWQSAAVYPNSVPTYPAATYPAATYPPAGTGYAHNYGAVPSGYGTATGGTYVVRRGDNLSTIARNHGCTVGELMQMNGLLSSMIQPGQMLNLPR